MRKRGSAQQPEEKPIIQVPADAISERAVLAVASSDGKALEELAKRVRPDMFHVPEHAEHWVVLTEILRKGLQPDPATIHQVSGGRVQSQQVAELIKEANPANLKHHLDEMDWQHVRISAVQGPLDQFLKAVQDPMTQAAKLLALSKQLTATLEHAGDDLIRDSNVVARLAAAEIAGRKNRPFSSYGIPAMDRDEKTGHVRFMPGSRLGDITLLTSNSGSGKTTFAAHMAHGIARYTRRRTLYCEWEATGESMLEVCALVSLGYSRYKAMAGELTEEECKLHQQRMEAVGQYVRFAKMPFSYRDTRLYNEDRLEIIGQMIARSGCEVVIFDLWERALRHKKPEDIEFALNVMQGMAKDLKVHFVIVQQQRLKDVETRQDARPTREGVKGSAAYVEVPDTIIALHRPGLVKNVSDTTLELYCLKQRWGKWPFAVEFDWDSEFGSLANPRTLAYQPPRELQQMDKDVTGFLRKPFGKNGVSNGKNGAR